MDRAKQIWIGTSWKMNKTLVEAVLFAEKMANSGDFVGIQKFVVPSFTVARQVKAILNKSDIKVGAQNMHWADEGAWTGEISAPMLSDCNLDIVELGHSERRAHFGETDESVSLKVEAAIRHGLIPLVCVGETLEERESGQTQDVLERQVRYALSKIPMENYGKTILLAYEPVWAIGDSGIPATSEYASKRHSEIVDIAQSILGRRIPCLYGGSVNKENCEELISSPHIDGLFIGRSAWNVDDYLEILKKCAIAIKGE